MLVYNRNKSVGRIQSITVSLNPLSYVWAALLMSIAYGFATSAWNTIVDVKREHVRTDSQSRTH